MAPAPTYEHRRIVDEITEFLRPLRRRRGRGVLSSGINVINEASKETDYRIPDFSFVAKGREHILADDGIRGGGPDAVIEIRSPYDETYDKLPFFAALGVREVIVIDRDTKRTELYRLAGSQYVAIQADAGGWLGSEIMKVRFANRDTRFVIEDVDEPTTCTEI